MREWKLGRWGCLRSDERHTASAIKQDSETKKRAKEAKTVSCGSAPFAVAGLGLRAAVLGSYRRKRMRTFRSVLLGYELGLFVIFKEITA